MRSAQALAWLVAWSLTRCAAPFSAVAPRAAELRFDHVQIFADEVAPVADYKRLEAEAAALGARLDAGEALPAGDAFDGLNRDVVRQLVWKPGGQRPMVDHRNDTHSGYPAGIKARRRSNQ